MPGLMQRCTVRINHASQNCQSFTHLEIPGLHEVITRVLSNSVSQSHDMYINDKMDRFEIHFTT